MSGKKHLEMAESIHAQEDEQNATFPDHKKADLKQPSDDQPIGELPPTYKSLNIPHHPYNTTNAGSSSSNRSSAGQNYTGGSCGVPASVIQGVMGPPRPKGEKGGSDSKWPWARQWKKGSRPVWNAEGMRLSHMGGPFTKSKK